MLRALLFFLVPSAIPWYRRYAEYVTKHCPGRRATLLSLFDREKVFSYRYDILCTRWFNVGIHNIVNSDEPLLHTHDWSFWTFMLEGGYVEHTEDGLAHVRPVGYWLRRPFQFQHYIEVGQDSAWTLLITTKKKNVHQFNVPNVGLVRWDVLIFSEILDPFRDTLTGPERRMMNDAGKDVLDD